MALWFSVRIIALRLVASASPQIVLTKRDGSIVNATAPLQHFVFGNDMAIPDVDGKKMISFVPILIKETSMHKVVLSP